MQNAADLVKPRGDKMNQGDTRVGSENHPGMGRPPAKHKVYVRDLLLRVMADRGMSRDELAEALDVRPKTLDGLLNKNDPRPASQDVQTAIRRAFPDQAWTDIDKLPNCGFTLAGSRINFTTRPVLRSEISIVEPVAELGALPGDTLVIEPATQLGPDGWWVVEADGEQMIVKAGLIGETPTIREADDRRVLVYQAPYVVRAKILKHVRNL